MEKHAANNLNYLIRVQKNSLETLAVLRKWAHLKIGFDDTHIWLNGLNYAEIYAETVLSIPFIDRFEEKEGKLYRLGKLLPETVLPNVLWTPITRGIPVQLPKLNHNFFGLQEKVKIRLVQAPKEEPVCAQLILNTLFREYMETAPQNRLVDLEWTRAGENHVLVMGVGLLPLPGEVYWKRDRHLLPAGFDFEFPDFSKSMYDVFCSDGISYLFWKDEVPLTLPIFTFTTLSISSVRNTFSPLSPTHD